MSSFVLNIENNTKQVLQPQLVKSPWIAWLKTLLFPLSYSYTQFVNHRNSVNYNLTINSQVNRLQKALRDKFEIAGINIITIEDSITESYMYTLAEEQNQSLVIHTILEEIDMAAIYTDVELNNEIDFIVEVPEGNESKESQIKAFVDRYKYAGKKFIIQYI